MIPKLTLPDLVRSGITIAQEQGASALAQHTLKKGRVQFNNWTGRYQGTSVLNEDWDVLVVLDACRVDALQLVADEFEFLPLKISGRSSVGSASDTWLQRTFSEEFESEANDTIYVTANPNTAGSLPKGRLGGLKEVWKGGYDSSYGTTPARTVTNHAIETSREDNPERLIVHYMQPHFPSIPEPLGFGIRKGADNPSSHEWVWSNGKPDQYSHEELWQAYVENLRYVLDDIRLLLDNITGDTVIITADHGNAFGEQGIWGHPHQQTRVLREVPWVKTSAVDSGTHQPDMENLANDNISVEEKLEALGYKE